MATSITQPPKKRGMKLRHADPATNLAWRSITKWTSPLWVKLLLITLFLSGFVPLAWALRERMDMAKPLPRIHPIQDMDNMPYVKAQDASPLFADGRANRPPVPGTIARGELNLDDHFYLGFAMAGDASADLAGAVAVEGSVPEARFYTDFPDDIVIDEALLRRGQQVFGITCASCHGKDGHGRGPIHVQAVAGGSSSWVQPTDLHSDVVRGRPDGHIYNTINNGIRSMTALGHIIEPADRWAVVAYVRALQLSRRMPAEMLSEQERQRLQ